MRRRLSGLVLACAASAAGEARAGSGPLSLFPAVEHRERFEVDPLASTSRSRPIEKVFTIEWRVPLTDFDPMLFRPREAGAPAVDRVTGYAYAGTRDGRLTCMDTEDGSVVWQFDCSGPVNGGPGLGKDRVYVSSGGGLLYALDAGTGKHIWTYESKEELLTAPVQHKDLVYVMSGADALVAVGANDGKWRWQHRRDSPSNLTVRGAARPAIHGGRVFAGFSDGYAVALDAEDGTVKWATRLSSPTRTQLCDVDSEAAFSEDGGVFMASYSDGVYRLRQDNGHVEWQTAVAGATGLTVKDSFLYAGAAGHLLAMDLATGKSAWDVSVGNLAVGKPRIAGGTLVAPTAGPLVFVDLATGRPRRSFNPGRGVTAPPDFYNGTLFVLSNMGQMYALHVESQGR